MKIYVKDGNTGHKIRLALPSRLIFGKFGQAIVKRAIKSELKHNSSDEECVAGGRNCSLPSLCLYRINQFCIYNLCCSITDTVHALYPQR